MSATAAESATSATPTAAIIGEGRLADMVCGMIGADYSLIRQHDRRDGIPPHADIVLVLRDGWDPQGEMAAEQTCREAGVPWLRGFIAFGEGVVGPLVIPGKPGCSQCADDRRIMAGRDRREMWLLKERTMQQPNGSRDPWASTTGLARMACLIADETKRLLRRLPGRTTEQVYIINFTTLNISRHPVLADPLCPVCGRLPDDAADRARITLSTCLKTNPDGFRCRPMDAMHESLGNDYLDSRSGVLNGSMYDLTSPFADASVNLPLNFGDEGAAGRTHRYSDSLSTAILEGLERLCGLAPRGKRTVVQGSYRELERLALRPESVGVHAPEAYARPDFPFPAFDPERTIRWVWGFSFARESPILVPEQLAYYSTGHGEGYVYETSNGCALGGSLEEAIFHGIMEVAERDAFLMAWYARLPLPKLDHESAEDPEMRLMIERLKALTGYEIALFNATMEHGIPCVWSLAKNTRETGANLICAAGASPDPVRAAKSSIHELAGMLLSQNERFADNRSRIEKMLHDPYEVRHMEDHSMLYALPEAESRLRFLLDSGRPVRSFREEYGQPGLQSMDLTDDLRSAISSFLQLDMDVIVVDQTSQETLRNGLHCVKVLIPGMLPMTFGYHLTRLTGLERVLNVPAKLGYANQPLRPDQLNPFPHPFP